MRPGTGRPHMVGMAPYGRIWPNMADMLRMGGNGPMACPPGRLGTHVRSVFAM